MAPQGVRRMMIAFATGSALLLAGCSGGGDEDAPPADPDGVEDPFASGAEDDEPDGPAAELLDAVNAAMSGTTFHASGATTAFEDGRQEMWSDPEVGVRIEVTTAALPEHGEMYCQDGVVYTGVPLFAAQLRESGEELDVPEDLTDRYISTQAGSDCRLLYEIFPGATLDPEMDDTVDGVPTTALVAATQGATDVYHAAAEGEPYLLRMDSERDGRTSSTVYDSFGEEMDIQMPPEDSIMSMDEFRGLVQSAG
jgi:hypothetical protein